MKSVKLKSLQLEMTLDIIYSFHPLLFPDEETKIP